jgi:hypothetical protein
MKSMQEYNGITLITLALASLTKKKRISHRDYDIVDLLYEIENILKRSAKSQNKKGRRPLLLFERDKIIIEK